MKTNQLLFILGFFLLGGFCPLFSQNQQSEHEKTVPQQTSVLIMKPLSAGWTWFSLNVTGPDMSVASVLGSLETQDGDYIKNQTVSATYYEGSGWFGELTVIDPKEMYKIKLSQACTLTFTGDPADIGTNSISIKNGWNWIGYLPQTALTVTEALSTIVPVAEDYIKNQTKSSTFYEGSGWFGEMTNLEPLDGYMLKTSHTGTLTYPEPKSGSFTDARDGKTYPWIKIGDQTWMAENLAFLRSVSPSSSGSETDPYYYVYDYQGTIVFDVRSTTNYNTYGVLYNWEAAKTACPNGWYLPNDAEWTTLTDYLGGEEFAGGKIKENGTSHWWSPNRATNVSGFTALPGGYRLGDGRFDCRGGYSNFWSSSESGSSNAWYRGLSFVYDGVYRFNLGKTSGYAVRCLQNPFTTVTTAEITEITQTTASSGGNVTSDGGASITARGVCWAPETDGPTTDHPHTTDGTGNGLFSSTLTGLIPNTRYFVRAYATNSLGTSYGDPVSFTTKVVLECDGRYTDDRDGQEYCYKNIGTQTWMIENLAYLPSVGPYSGESYIDPYYYVYGNQGSNISEAKSTINYSTYGVLYNWEAAETACPSGWHLPSDDEWTILTDYLTDNGYGYGGSGSDIGKSMAATSGWDSCSNEGTVGNDQASNNTSGFTALPGGFREIHFGDFESLGSTAYFWSSTWGDLLGPVWGRYLYNNNSGWGLLGGSYYSRGSGFSIRCLKNNTPPTASFKISPTGGVTSTIFQFDASGSTDAETTQNDLELRWDWNEAGFCTEYTTTKTATYQFLQAGNYLVRLEVKDGGGLLDTETKTLRISVPDGVFVDSRDGQQYSYKTIDNQTWMTENLNFQSANSWCYNDSASNCTIYGRLYDWETAKTVCPSDWHLPSDPEWNLLIDYLGSSAGLKMKATSGWSSNGNGNNTSGFTALPGGSGKYFGGFGGLGTSAYFWSSSLNGAGAGWDPYLSNDYDKVYLYHNSRSGGFSVRCLMN